MSKNQKVFFPLEERIVLDAAALAVATDNINDDSQSYQDDSSVDANQNNEVNPLDNIAENVVPLTNNRIVIIDERSDPNSEIRNYLDNKNVSFYTIKADQDGVSEISNILNKYHGVETLDIISHGSEGSLQLGNSELNNDTLNEYYQELSSWADNFSQSADIMIYGCDVASGVDGVHFIKSVSEITGTDIGSSDDTTGKSGDWTLEHFLGEVESGLIIDSNANLDVDLKHKTKSGDSGKNDKPEVENIKVSTDYDTNVGITLEGSDDKPANQLKFSFIKLPDADEGEFKLNGNTIELGDEISYADRDDIIFDPANDFDGKAKAKYVATDADGLTSKYAKIYVEVDNESYGKTKGSKNYKPEVEDIKVSTDHDTNVGITLEGSDDKPANQLKFSFIELPDASEGEFKLNGNTIELGDEISYADSDDIIFDPAYDFDGKAKAKYVATDAEGLTSKYAKIYVEVDEASGNIAPDAKNDNVVTYEDHSITIDVLANDQDANGDDIVIDSVTDGSNGNAAIVNGSIVYTPNNGYSGTDTFTYSIKDGNGGTDTATVTVDVCPNPDLHFSDSFTIGLDEDYTFASDDPLYEAEDFITGEKYLVGVDLEDLNTPHNVSIDQNLIDNSTVTIHKGANGTNSLWFKGTSEDIQTALQTLKFSSASDNSSNDTIVVCLFKHIDGVGYKHIDINFIDANVDSSVLANDDTLKAYEDTALTITPSDILGNDIGNVNIINYTQPSNGTITQDGNGNLVYTPNQDYNGPDSFTYTVSGQGGSYSNNLIVNGSFESDDVSGAWAVYPNGITGWQTDMGPGIEIQVGNTGGIDATDGDQKVELDSHNATDTNSNMYQDVDVSNSNDTVLLQFDYSARNSGDTSTSSIIEVYWDSELVDTITASTSGWNTYSYQLSTVGKDTSRLEFRAAGTDDTYGGLIDNVKLLDSNPSTSTATVHIDVCPVNDAPVALDDTATTDEDAPVTIDVLANDDDVDGDNLTVTDVTNGQNGTVTIGTNGEVTYTPNDDFTGADTFEYTVSDGNGGTHTGTVTVTVNPVNDAPVANDDTATTSEDTPVTIDVLNNDTDVDGDTITVESVTDGSNGTTTINVDGDVVYTPNTDFNGTDTFEYTITDGNGEAHTATVTVTVNPVNDAPVANNDSATTDEDTPVTINVLANDGDVDGDSLTVTDVTNGQNGTVTIGTNGEVTYTPNDDFTGTDTFEYTVSDGNGGTHTGTVTVTVNPVNDAPVANDDSATTNEDTPVTIDVLNNDTDTEGDNLEITNVTNGSNGTTSINNQGDVVYTPNPNFNGTDTFEYTITDGSGETHTATVTVEVCPVADHLQVNDDSYTPNDGDNLTSELITQEDTPLDIEVSDLLENDEGISILPDSAKFVIETTPTNGTLYLVNGQNLTQLNSGDKVDTDSLIRFVPDQGADGIDNFQYSIHSPYEGFDNINDYQNPIPGTSNGNGMDAVEGSDPGEHEVSVSFVSKSAGFDNTLGYYVYDKSGNIIESDIIWSDISGSQPDSVIGNLSEGQYLGFFLAADGGDTSLNNATEIRFVDENGQNANFNTASNGQSEFNLQYKNGNGNWTDYNGGTDKGVFHSNSAQLNPDNLEHVVTGKIDVQGQSQLKVTFEDLYVNSDWDANDLEFIVNVADQNSNVANVTINVENTNDAPVANTDNVTTLEDVAITIDALGNDTYSDGDVLTITQADNGSNGTVNIVNNKLVYTPNDDFYGNDTFTYTITDGNGETSTANVNVNVLPINDAPIANPDNVSTNEDTPVVIDVIANDTDIDGLNIELQSVNHGANGTVTMVGGKAVYTPNADFVGTDTFTYAVTDNNGGLATGTVTVTVNPINDAPVANDDSAITDEDTPVTIDVLANDTDVDGDTLTVESVTDGSNGTTSIDGNGDIVYTPNADFTGTDTFEYTITDGNETHTGTVTVTVNPINDAPVAVDDSAITDEDTPVTIDVLNNDTDVDGDTLTVESVTDGSNGTTSIDGNGDIVYTPNADFTGTDTFEYTITDGNETHTGTVTVTVNPINDAPVANDDSATTDEDTPVTIDVLANDTDVDGDTLTVESVTDGSNGTTSIDGNGDIVYTPNADFTGTDTFEYTITDGNETHTGTVTVTVNPINDAPVAVDDSAITDEDTPVTIDVLANDTDVDGDTLTVESVTDGSNGTTSIDGNGDIVYTPNADFTGTDTFEYTITDGNETHTGTVTVTVNPINDAPVAVDDSATTDEDTPVTIDVLANDTDVDGDTLTVESVTDGSNGTTSINGDGDIVYTPNADFTGTDTFEYTITDGNETHTGTVTVTVNPINDAPVANDDSATTDEDTPVTIDVLANDTDVDGDTLTVESVTDGSNGTTSIDGNGDIVYTPNADFTGTDTFEYTITDGNETHTGTVTVTVNPINDAPVAVDDSATTDEDTPVTIDVLANDTDVDGDTLTVESVTDGSNGTTSINGDGDIVYTPNADFTGTDTFEYTITDGNETHTGTVTVTVNPINDAPVANDDSATTDEDTPVTIDVLANDTDVDGDTLTVESVTDGSNGTTSIDGNGDIVYTPNADFTGTDTFEYTITDGNETHTGTVTVTVNPVNDAPVANDDSATTDEDTPVTIDVLANDNDVDGDTILIDFVTNGQNGTTTVVNNQVVYTPNPNFFGIDTFTTYVITDGQGGQAQANVTVEVLPINDNPVAVNDTAFTSEDVPITIDVINNDTDIEGDTLELYSTTNGSNGTVTMVGGKAVYTPNAGFNGTDTFTYVVSDQNGGFDTGTVTVEVISTNEAPYANDDSALTVQGEARTINVLANDYDQDGTIVDVLAVDQPSNGTITINPNGTIVYNPNAGFVGVDTFTYRVIDNEQFTSLPAKVTVTVKPLTLPDLGPGGNDEDDNDGNNPQNTTFGTPSTLTNIGTYDPYGKISDFEYSDYALKLVLELPDVVKKSEGSQDFGIPQASFEHSNPNAKITYDALLADGTDLPSWMEFNSEEGTFRISPPQLPNENFEILVTAQDEEGNEAASTFTLILLDENNVAFLDENNNGENTDDNVSEDADSPVDEAFEALLKEFNEVTELESSEGFTPFSKQLQNNLKTELDDRVLELIKNMYAA